MRLLSQPVVESKTVQSAPVKSEVVKQGSVDTTTKTVHQESTTKFNQNIENKLQRAVDSLNEILEINHNSTKFVYHEGLDRYYVQVVNKDSKEVIKEIPPKKLLDAFYEMQKLVGMIVDEQI